MIWYRLVRTKHIILDSDIISGEHTKLIAGRWHTIGIPTIYFGDSPETVVAECGKYWICDEAERINRALAYSGHPPSEWLSKFEPISIIEAYLAAVEINDSIPFLDFVQDPPALSFFQNAGFPELSLNVIRQNAFLTIPNHATRKIGEFYYNLKTPFLKVPSARSNGVCGVLFPGNYLPSQVQLINKFIINMYALDEREKRISGKQIIKLNEMVFEYEHDKKIYRIDPLRL